MFFESIEEMRAYKRKQNKLGIEIVNATDYFNQPTSEEEVKQVEQPTSEEEVKPKTRGRKKKGE